MIIEKTVLSRRCGRSRFQILFYAFLTTLTVGSCFDREACAQQVQWIWTSDHRPNEVAPTSCFFRKSFRMLDPEQGQLQIAANDRGEVYLNGTYLGAAQGSERTTRFNITSTLVPGVNVLAVQVDNTSGTTAGLAAALVVKEKNEEKWRMLPSGENWIASTDRNPDWMAQLHDDSAWRRCQIVQLTPPPTVAPALNTSTAKSPRDDIAPLPAPTADASAAQKPSATDEPAAYSIVPEFVVKTIENSSIGSLIAMEFDEWGRLVCSREEGGLVRIDLRIAPDQPGHMTVICDQIHGCQGILALSGNLYVTGQGPDGLALYRLRDANNDGSMEQITALLKFTGSSGEHGPHGLTLGPDGYLYVIIGNASGIKGNVSSASPYAKTYEANIVPRIEDQVVMRSVSKPRAARSRDVGSMGAMPQSMPAAFAMPTTWHSTRTPSCSFTTAIWKPTSARVGIDRRRYSKSKRGPK